MSRLDEIRAQSAQRRAQEAAKEQAAQKKREALLASRTERMSRTEGAARPRRDGARVRVDANANNGVVAVESASQPTTTAASSTAPAAPPTVSVVKLPETTTAPEAGRSVMALAPAATELERVVVETPPVPVAPLVSEPAPATSTLPDRQGLSTGAKVALGVGALAATATVVALVVRD